jgi:hypothetical protein
MNNQENAINHHARERYTRTSKQVTGRSQREWEVIFAELNWLTEQEIARQNMDGFTNCFFPAHIAAMKKVAMVSNRNLSDLISEAIKQYLVDKAMTDQELAENFDCDTYEALEAALLLRNIDLNDLKAGIYRYSKKYIAEGLTLDEIAEWKSVAQLVGSYEFVLGLVNPH